MSAPQDDALAAAVAEHGPFPMPVGKPMPVELSEQQLEALSAAGNRALNDHYHEDLCFCRSWPTSCESSGHYFMGTWDTAAFDIGLPAVLGVWESLRNDRHAAKIAELRADNERLRTDANALRDQRNAVFATNEELLVRVERADLERLNTEAENRRLARRVGELEAMVSRLGARAEQRHLMDPLDHVLEHLADERPAVQA